MRFRMKIREAPKTAPCGYCHTLIKEGEMEVSGFSRQLPDIEKYLERARELHADFQFTPVFHYHLKRTKLEPSEDELVFLLNESIKECPGFIEIELESFIAPLLRTLVDPLGSEWEEIIQRIIQFYQDEEEEG